MEEKTRRRDTGTTRNRKNRNVKRRGRRKGERKQAIGQREGEREERSEQTPGRGRAGLRRAGPSRRQPAAPQNPEEKVWLPKAESPRDGTALTQERLFKARRMTVCRTVINHPDDGN